jgi:transposase
VLVVDRYGAYNKAPCDIQYCYEHLKRPVEDLVKEFPNSEQIKNFADHAIPLLSQAMGLRSLNISDDAYYKKASQLKTDIIHEMNQPADHAGIQNIQTIFQQYAHRLYHWVDNRDILAENNFSERGFRRLVIARKISFGSQSDNGANTREILMTVLHSLKKRDPDVYRKKFKSCLNQLAQNPRLDPYNLLFENDTS